MGFEVFFGGRQVGDHTKSHQGAGLPSVVLGLERPSHFRHNNKREMAKCLIMDTYCIFLFCFWGGTFGGNSRGTFGGKRPENTLKQYRRIVPGFVLVLGNSKSGAKHNKSKNSTIRQNLLFISIKGQSFSS